MVKESDGTIAARAALDYLVSWIEYRVWRSRVPGAQVAIWFGGGLRMSKAFGVADVTTGERLTATHQFRVASHSKMLAATVVLQLVEQGRLRLDDAASAHVPQLLGTGAEHGGPAPGHSPQGVHGRRPGWISRAGSPASRRPRRCRPP
jgi:CubicO group peptidase (beta-lactamase class C family)